MVGKLTGGLAGMAKARKVSVLQGVGRFLDPYHLEVAANNGGGRKVVKFDKAIIAAGSQAIKLPFIPDDPRVVDSTGALELRQIPKSMLVIGGGIIGLEMATVYSTLGTRIDVVEMLDGLMTGADRDLVKVWEEERGALRQGHVEDQDGVGRGDAGRHQGRLRGREGAGRAPALRHGAGRGRPQPERQQDRRREGRRRGERPRLHPVDKQMRTNMPHIFAIGDIVGQPMLAHKAVHEAHVAAETAAGKNSVFEARQIPSVAYTDPEVAWAGVTEEQCKAQGIKYGKAVFPWAASGRAIANGRDEGFTKLLFDEANHRVLGGGIVGTHAGDLIGEVCLAVEMGCDPVDIGKTIHPHPDLCGIDRHDGGSVRGRVHRSAARQEEDSEFAPERDARRSGGHDGRATAPRRTGISSRSDVGKISVTPTKSLVNQRDLALAYSPGVAYACLAIKDDPKEAAR